MKLDEYEFLIGLREDLPKKRLAYVLKKWEKRGWRKDGEYTDEYYRVRELAKNKKRLIYQCDGRVVVVNFIEGKGWYGQVAGILVDHGDNGWHLYTSRSGLGNWSYYLGDYKFDDIAYVELHPRPRSLWRKLNYLYWKHHRSEDHFHKKISEWDYGSIRHYSGGVFTATNPAGKIGECYPDCQCRMLGDSL